MTVDKLNSIGLKQGHEAVPATKARDSHPVDSIGKNTVAALPQQGTLPATASLSRATVSVSVTAKELFGAVKSVSDEDEFDLDKVEQIRKEIASGRFPIDEERLARKFRELEQQLGDLGG